MRFFITAACFFLMGTIASQLENRIVPSTASEQLAQEQKTPAIAPAETQSNINPEKESDIRKLLDTMGAENAVTQILGDSEKTIRPMLANSLPPGDYRDKLIDLFLAKLLSKLDSRQIAELSIPVYDKYYSDQEVKDLTVFYGTPTGKKAMNVMPKMAAELQEKGRKIGQAAGLESMQEVLSEHPELKQALEEAAKKAKQ